jgi:hypothetical protein
MSTDILNKSEVEQRHFYEERFTEHHQECHYSHVAGITLGVCKCGEYFFVHTETPFAGERQLKTQWRSHARGQKNADKRQH